MIASAQTQQNALQSQNPETMSNWLNGSPKETTKRLMALSVPENVARIYGEEQSFLKWQILRKGADTNWAVMFLPCELDDAYVYVMHYDGTAWHATDSDSFDCHYDMSVRFKLAPVLLKGDDAVLIHHANEGHGTGYVEQHFEIEIVKAGKLRVVLDRQEVMLLAPPRGQEIRERNDFVLLPALKIFPRIVEETKTTRTGEDELQVQRRYFRWSEKNGEYLPSRFIAVKISSN
jgi:hypothetical protein